MASIQTRSLSDGSQSFRVVYRVDGKQLADTLWTYDDALAHKALVEKIGGAQARRVLLAREAAPRDARTLADYAVEHVRKLEDVTDGTRRDYLAMIANRLEPTPLGQMPLVAIQREDVTAWLDGMDVSVKTRRNYHALISTVLGAALDAGAIARNPARGIRVRQTVPVADMVLITPGELAVLIAEIPTAYQPLVMLLAATGLRWGEATALRVGDVDLDARVPLLRVGAAWKRTGTGRRELGPPKTRAGVRTIGLGPTVAEAIRPLVEGRPHDAWLFTNTVGNPVLGSNFHRNTWQPALRRLNDSGRMTKRPRIHDLRHFAASQQVQNGVNVLAVKKRMGHESITTTVDRYSHLAPDYLEVTAAAADLGLVQAMPEIED